MTQCSTYSQRFIYVVVRRIETVSYTKRAKSAMTQNTRNQRVAKLSGVRLSITLANYSTDSPKGYMYSRQMLLKIFP